MIATETLVPVKKLKVKLAGKRVEAHPWNQSCDFGQLVVHSASVNPSEGRKNFTSSCSDTKSSMPNITKKRMSLGVLEGPKEKRQKMDRGVSVQCSGILKSLMSHPAGWVFNQPVDPVALKIPDYLSVISHPMDLGTIKSKLIQKIYLGTEEFAADVRLTFSNAMLYNPPANSVHQMAKDLSEIFECKWKLLADKRTGVMSNFEQGKSTIDHKATLSRNSSSTKKSVPSGEQAKKQSLKRNNSPEAGLSKTAHHTVDKSPGINFHKGTSSTSKHTCPGSITAKRQLSLAGSKCGTCGNITCQCRFSTLSTRGSSDLSSERSIVTDHKDSIDICPPDCQSKVSTSSSHIPSSDPDYDGVVGALDDEKRLPSNQPSTPPTNGTSEEGCWTPIFDVQLSPKKALRAAMLKSRFADTILKAQNKTLLHHGDKVDSMKMQQKKERLEKLQREERARIEAQIKAAEAAEKLKLEAELKQQREQKREAARAALEKMEKSVEIDQNLIFLKELAKLSGVSIYTQPFDSFGSRSAVGASQAAHPWSPLQRLGLFMKDELLEEEEGETIVGGGGDDGEEGEIL